MATTTPDQASAPTRNLLARAHSPDTANRIYTDKIQYRNLYLRATSPPPSVVATRNNARAARRKAREDKKVRQKRKPTPLSSRQRRALGLRDVPPPPSKGGPEHRYAVFEPLHDLWLGYMREILGSDLRYGGPGAAAKLSAAEFQGAKVEVSRSGCPSRVGIKGIIIKDAKFVFEIVTPKNEVKTVPKEGTWFRISIPVEEEGEEKEDTGKEDDDRKMTDREEDGANAKPPRHFVFEILGDQFLMRGSDRANKKFKAHFLKKV